jgi:ribonuclease P protein component
MKARLLDVRRLASAHGHVRVAVLVPKLGFTAVRRNKLKRQMRELARHLLAQRPASCDVLLRARREAYEAPFERLQADVEQIAAQIP